MSDSLFPSARAALTACEADEKIRLTRTTAAAWRAGQLDAADPSPALSVDPGLPLQVSAVRPRALPQRGFDTPAGRASLFHALVHIEFSAINLAWDAVWRFRGLPAAYYDDWIRIAEEEALHFELLRDHLRTLGADYGDLPVHQGLWEMAEKTGHDPLVRMALIPRCLEARGLDVNPGMQQRLQAVGDSVGVGLLEIILRDEIGHVAVGDRWFRHLCAARGLPVVETYRDLLAEYLRGPVRGPLHRPARLAAGFSAEELDALEQG